MAFYTNVIVLYTIRKLLIPSFKQDTSRTGIPTIKRAIRVFLKTNVTHISSPFLIQIAYFKMSVWPVRCALQDEILHLL